MGISFLDAVAHGGKPRGCHLIRAVNILGRPQDYALRIYFRCLNAPSKTALHRFAKDAVVEDPVGTAPISDPDKIIELGNAFMSGFKTVSLHEEFVHVVGNEAAARWTGRGITEEGKLTILAVFSSHQLTNPNNPSFLPLSLE